MKSYTSENNRSPNGSTILILILSIALAFVGGLMAAPYVVGVAWATEPAALAPRIISEDEILDMYGTALTRIYDQAAPSVVKLNITRSDPEAELAKGVGSGFVWDSAGHIVTNFHVVNGADQIVVGFVDGISVEAEVVDTHSLADLAVLKVDRGEIELQPVILGDGTNLKVGQLTLAVGTPFGQDFTMTQGIISAVDRTIRTCESCYPIPDTIQTDTPINPGNSGGPLFNQRGEVIGINTWAITKRDSNTGVSFAISIEVAKQIVPHIIDGSD